MRASSRARVTIVVPALEDEEAEAVQSKQQQRQGGGGGAGTDNSKRTARKVESRLLFLATLAPLARRWFDPKGASNAASQKISARTIIVFF